MIFGIGVDLIDEKRIAATLDQHPRRFPQRLLHPEELARFHASSHPINVLAKAWAAKEAFGKALGTGVRGYANPEVGVVRGAHGKPGLVYSEAMKQRLEKIGINRSHVSLSDESGLIVAYVVLES